MKHRIVFDGLKSMGKTGRDIQEFTISVTKKHTYMLAEGRRTFPDVDHHIHYRSPQYRYKLNLRIHNLIMKPPQHASSRYGDIVLYKVRTQSVALE